MRDFKFFQKENKSFFTRMAEQLETSTDRIQNTNGILVPQTNEGQQSINDVIRREEYLNNTYIRNISVSDYGQMARDIRELSQLRTIERPFELYAGVRRPRNPF